MHNFLFPPFQGEEIFLDMFEDEYRSMTVSEGPEASVFPQSLPSQTERERREH